MREGMEGVYMEEVVRTINKYLEWAAESISPEEASEWRTRAFAMEEALHLMGIQTVFILNEGRIRLA